MTASLRAHRLLFVLLGIGLLVPWFAVLPTAAVAPGNAAFQRTWARTDKPVLDGNVARTWIWGPEAFTDVVPEPYLDSPGGMRDVQYFDKSRMEINDPAGDPDSLFYVTNGLLVVEMITGNLQLGDNFFEQRNAAQVNVAGDSDDPVGPTYATFAQLLDVTAGSQVDPLRTGVNRDGSLYDSDDFAAYGIGDAIFVDVTQHWIAEPFWEVMNSSGLVYENGVLTNAPLFQNPYYATGYPITDPYWARVKVAGTYRNVLMQCFERRCLTYTPGNPTGFLTEAGNVGQHYYTWRTTSQPLAPYDYLSEISTFDDPRTQPLLDPAGVAVDQFYDKVFVVDRGHNQIQEFDKAGVFLRRWGSQGQGDGQFESPADATVGINGTLLVADSSNNRVQIFDTDGTYLSQFGTFGDQDGQFNNPLSIAIGEGVIYVADTGNNRIQMFDFNGVWQKTFGEAGSGAGALTTPRGVAVSPDGTVYVADTFAHRIVKFSWDGVYDSAFGVFGDADGEFDVPSGVDIDYDFNIYVADNGNQRVQKFDSNAVHLDTWTTAGPGGPLLGDTYGIAMGLNGIYVTSSDLDEVVWFSNDGGLNGSWGEGYGAVGSPQGLEAGPNDTLYICSTDLDRVERLTTDGGYLTSWGSWGEGDSQFEFCRDVAVDDDGNVYVTDQNNMRVLKYDADGNYLLQWEGEPGFPLAGPSAIDYHNGVIYVHGGINRLEMFTTQGVFIDRFDDPVLPHIQGLAVAVDGSIYAANFGSNYVVKLDSNGNVLKQWGSAGSSDGQFDGPRHIAIDSAGRVYVVDTGNNRIQVFDADGIYLDQWGTSGSGPSQFNGPYGITIDADDHVWVSDQSNQRIQEFASADGT